MNSAGFYRAFEERLRGPRELILQRLTVYLPFVAPFNGLYVPTEAIDLGCGRGEWLELLRQHGIAARGIDLDDDMLQACRERALPVERGDALAHLAGLADASQCLVSGFHFAEHIAFDDLQTLAAEALRVLKPGGLLILETPNPENVLVGAHRFYLDPTHERPLPPLLLSFTAEHAGFARVKTVRLQEPAELAASTEARLLDVFEGVSPDYAIVAQKCAAPLLMQRFDAAFAKPYGLELAELATRVQQSSEQRVDHLQHALADAAAHVAAESERLSWVDGRLREQIEPGFEQLSLGHAQHAAAVERLAQAHAHHAAQIDQLAQTHAHQAADVQHIARANAQQAAAVDQLTQQQAAAVDQLTQQQGQLVAATEQLDRWQRSQTEAIEQLPGAFGARLDAAAAAQAAALRAQQAAEAVRWRRLVRRLARQNMVRLGRLEQQTADAVSDRALLQEQLGAQPALMQGLQQRVDDRQRELLVRLEAIELQTLEAQQQRAIDSPQLLAALHAIGLRQQAAEQEHGAAAQRLAADLQAMRTSWSWRVTAPLRWALGLLVHPGTTARGLANQTIGRSIERFQQPLAATMRVVLRDPVRSHRINQLLLRFPALHGHLVSVAGRHAVIALRPDGTAARCSYDEASLSPRAHEIFSRLKSAIDIQEKKASR